MKKAEIGIIGGSGFYSFLEDCQAVKVSTPYGSPSSPYLLGKIGEKKVAFLARHGTYHQYPPHKIPCRANIFGFKKLGVRYIIAPGACGSLQPSIHPGDFVIADQFVDRTCGRKDTFYEGPKTVHIAVDAPFCPRLRKIAIKTGKKLKFPIHQSGTVVVINGPRFSTQAESAWFKDAGWQVINMTVYPEVVLARELEICYVNISLITDYDTGIKDKPGIKPVSVQEVIKIFKKNNEKVKKMMIEMIKEINTDYQCSCHLALKAAAV